MAATTTDANGDYSFTGLIPDSYTVTFTPPAGDIVTGQDVGVDDSIDSDVDSTGTSASITVDAGDSIIDVDAGAYQVASVAGVVWFDNNNNNVVDGAEQPQAGIAVGLVDSAGNAVATAVTDANGGYSFGGLVPDTYTISFVDPAGGLFGPLGATLMTTVNSGDAQAGHDTHLIPDCTIGGSPTPALSTTNSAGCSTVEGTATTDGDPMIDVGVKLVDGSGNTIATTATDNNGEYLSLIHI